MTPLDRFLAKVEPEVGGCWRWTGALHPWGYGQFQMGRRSDAGNLVPEKAHRWAYEFFIGPIAAGLYIDHLCNNRACVNPTHLEPVTNGENLARGYRRRNPTHCLNGHPWTPDNTYSRKGSAGRSCRRCHADRIQAQRKALA